MELSVLFLILSVPGGFTAWISYISNNGNHTDIPSDIPLDVQEVSLDYNIIGSVESFPALADLVELYMSNNQLTNFPNLVNVSGLRKLGLSSNMISYIEGDRLTMLTSLIYLSLFSNQLAAVPQTPVALTSLNLGKNLYTACPGFATASRAASTVMMDKCNLAECRGGFFQGTTSVSSINFNSNDFARIPNLWFVRKTLLTIYLYNNKITQVHAEDLEFMEVLYKVTLTSNPLMKVPVIVTLPQAMTTLTLRNCPSMPCDYGQLKWINAVRISTAITVATSGSFGSCFNNITINQQFVDGNVVAYEEFDRMKFVGK